MNTKSQNGFTLIELMIVVAVVGILAAIAYPAYTESILKGKRAQARTALAELIQQQERYMTQQNCYMAFGTSVAFVSGAIANAGCGVTSATPVPFKNFSGDSTANAAYRLQAGACPGGLSVAECILVTANPTGVDARVGSLSITSTGAKSCTDTASADIPATSTNFRLCWP